MIGRGAMSAPDLFARARGERAAQLGLGDFIELWRRYYARLIADGAAEIKAISRVKQWLRFASPASPAITSLFGAFKTLRRWEQGDALLSLALESPEQLGIEPRP
jgi:tRNA-dihydrouridine synthase